MASSLFFEESNLECWEKRKVKVTENCVKNTDFAYAATSEPGHIPRQLPARLSGIRSIQEGLEERKSVPPSFSLFRAALLETLTSLNNRHWDKMPIIPRKTQQTDFMFLPWSDFRLFLISGNTKGRSNKFFRCSLCIATDEKRTEIGWWQKH